MIGLTVAIFCHTRPEINDKVMEKQTSMIDSQANKIDLVRPGDQIFHGTS